MNRLLATASFVSAACTFTLLAGQPVANVAATSGGVVTTPPSALLSPATAALSDGDDVRALGIRAVQFDQFQQPASIFVLSPATVALRDGDDIQARQLTALQH